MHLSFSKHQNLEVTKEIIQKHFLSKPSLNLPQSYAIVLKETNKMIGCCDFHTIIANDIGEIGYVLNKKYWCKGYVTEACRKLIEIGFEVLELRRIYIRHHRENIQSKRVIEKCGFIYEGIQREAKKNKDGTYSDLICYSLLRSDYITNKKFEEKEKGENYL